VTRILNRPTAPTPLAAYRPAAGPGVGHDLDGRQSFALFARMLFRLGYDDGLAGHITVRQVDGTVLTNPFAVAWNEIRASDVAVCTEDGEQIAGQYAINPAVSLHFALHRLRDVAVIVHNHPRYATIWSSHGRLPPVYDQSSALMSGELVLVDEYTGTVEKDDAAERILALMGPAEMAILAQHGVLVTADDLGMALTRCRVLELRACHAWHVEALGGAPTALPESMVQQLTRGIERMAHGAFPGYFELMARRELARDPAVLD
jgi:ribulose-5-phosphate 4-epimerase/fuculose-1-phosphate aldolase